ncbi:MAG: CPBP family intramembrane metalloprotease, partial [Proteobacteria bacterium]
MTYHRCSADREISVFLVLLSLSSAAAYGLIIHIHKEPAMLSRLIMWCPGAAALATCALHRIPRATLGWSWPATRWLVLAYVAPLLYVLPVYSVTWAVIAGSFAPADFLNATASQYGFARQPALATALVGVPLLATMGMVGGLTWALGEEIGWRGFLLPRLTQRIGFAGACLGSGLIWAVWHYPALLWADYNAGTDPAYAIICFTGSVMAMAFILGWLRLRTGSVWP